MKNLMLTALALLMAMSVLAQPTEPKKGYQFTDIKVLETTPVKNQNRSGTCWCYSTMSFLESEILREGGEAIHLSEMWIVRHSFMKKAERYVRLHGKLNFAEGGASHDVIEGIKEHGILPYEAYPGMNYGTELPDFHELTPVFTAYLNAVIAAAERSHKPLSTAWKRGFNALLDEYFGEVPATFTYQGKEYTPQSFAASLPIKMENYIGISSFTHHPFYGQFILEVPDNWLWGEVYNLPLEELMATIDHALAEGYTIAWGTDVSEKGFSRTKGVGVIPETNLDGLSGTEAERWGKLTDKEREAMLYKFEEPCKERVITQQMRQEAFDNYETTDDHGMVIVGTAKDQAGNDYYKVLNSWSEENLYKGFWYFSKPFVAYKTTSITINKNALPKEVAKKLGLR